MGVWVGRHTHGCIALTYPVASGREMTACIPPSPHVGSTERALNEPWPYKPNAVEFPERSTTQ